MIGKTINSDSLMPFREVGCSAETGHYVPDNAAKVVARGWQKHCCSIWDFPQNVSLKPGFSAVQEGRH